MSQMVKKEMITGRQARGLIIMFLLGTAALFVLGLAAKQDLWLSIILAVAVGIVITMMYARIITILPGKDFYETLDFFLGKTFSRVIFAIMAWYVFDETIIVLSFFGQFVVTVGLPETPLNVVNFIMILLCAFAVIRGIEVLGRWNQIFLFVVVGFIALMLVLAIPKIDITHLKPMLFGGPQPVMKGAFSVVMFPLLETIGFLLVLPALKRGVSGYKVFAGGLLIGGVILLLTSTMNLLVLGIDYSHRAAFPTYETLSALKAGKIFSRLEILGTMFYTISLFVKIAILLMAASKCFSKALGFKDYRFIVMPVALLVGAFAAFSFRRVGFGDWVYPNWPFYGGIYEIILPVCVWVFIEIKYRVLKKRFKLPRLEGENEKNV